MKFKGEVLICDDRPFGITICSNINDIFLPPGDNVVGVFDNFDECFPVGVARILKEENKIIAELFLDDPEIIPFNKFPAVKATFFPLCPIKITIESIGLIEMNNDYRIKKISEWITE